MRASVLLHRCTQEYHGPPSEYKGYLKSALVSGIGINRTRLLEEVTAGGFELVSVDEWPGWGHYVAVFEKPVS